MCALVCSTSVYLYSHTSCVLHVNVYSFYMYTVYISEPMCAFCIYVCACVYTYMCQGMQIIVWDTCVHVSVHMCVCS